MTVERDQFLEMLLERTQRIRRQPSWVNQHLIVRQRRKGTVEMKPVMGNSNDVYAGCVKVVAEPLKAGQVGLFVRADEDFPPAVKRHDVATFDRNAVTFEVDD